MTENIRKKITYSSNCCEGWHLPTHVAQDHSVVYRENADLYLCDECHSKYLDDNSRGYGK